MDTENILFPTFNKDLTIKLAIKRNFNKKKVLYKSNYRLRCEVAYMKFFTMERTTSQHNWIFL